MFTYERCPYKSHADHRDRSCDALHITHMGVLDVEAGRGLDNPEILTYSDVIPYATAVEPSCPFRPHELAVCHKAVDTFRSEKTDKTFHNLLVFLPVGVTTFREKAEYQREGNPFIGDAQHENVDIELSEHPVGAIHAEHKTGFDRKQRENHTGYDVKVKYILGKNLCSRLRLEFLSTAVGIASASLWRLIVCTTQSEWSSSAISFMRARFILCPKILLHNREDLVNFDQVLGVSSFHGEKSPDFSFKLLIFRDFCDLAI